MVHPQLFDQVWHGHRVEELGVGVMARRTSQVGAAVARITEDPGYRQRAQGLAALMAGEDGAEAIVRTITAMLAAWPGAPVRAVASP